MLEDNFNDNNNSDLGLNSANMLFEPSSYLPLSDTITPQITPNNLLLDNPFDSIIGETGSATLNHNQKTISFTGEYENPIVFATSLSRNGSEPAMVRITDITGSNFKAFVEEPNYLAPGKHANEQFSYVVMEAGTYQLEDGTLIEAGTIDTNAVTKKKWETIDFDSEFESAPIVLSQVQSHKGADFVRTRMQDITADGFKVSMEEEEKLAASGHAKETIGYFAISEGIGDWGDLTYQAGTTGDVVTHKARVLDFEDFTDTPNFMAGVASYDGADSVGVRYRNLGSDKVTIMLEEDKSKDAEIGHTTETVNFLAFSGDGFLTGADQNYVEPSIITVTSPNGGDQLEAGKQYNFTWTDNISENVRLDLYQGSTLRQTITSTPSDGSHYWTLPTNLTPGSNYRFKVSSTTNSTVTDWSNSYFTVIPFDHNQINDFDGDGKHDILWRNYETGAMHAWKMDGMTWMRGQDIDMPDISDSAIHPVALGDFNNDGHTDIITRYYWKDNPGDTHIWLMNRNQIAQQISLSSQADTSDPNWHISGTGDFNKDGNLDLLWRNYKTGENHVWMMNGTEYVESVSLLTIRDPNWKIVGTGDFDKDGNIDIVWRNGNINSIWMMNGTERREFINIDSTGSPAWKIVGTADFNLDGNIDLLWRENLTGDMGAWLMNGTERIGIDHSNWGSHHPKYHVVGETDPMPVWTAEYFNNKDLSGNPVHVEGVGNSYHANDYNKLTLNWGNGSPTNTPADGFSARFKTRRYLEPGLYQIKTGSDDGVRVIIDGEKVTDRWVDGGFVAGSDSGYFYSTGKEHDIKIEYYEYVGPAKLEFEIIKSTGVFENTDESQVWRASIYNWSPTDGNQPPQDFFTGDNRNRGIGSVGLGSNTRGDGKFGLSVNWEDGAINGDSRLPHDNFAIRAYSHKHLEAGKTYKLWVRGDDGFQFFAKKWHTNYNVDLLTNRRELPSQWSQNYGAAKAYEFTVDHTGWYDFTFHLYEGHSDSNFDFKLEEVSGESYYPGLAGLNDNEWDRQSGDDNQFRPDSPYGGGDQRSKTDDRIEEIYTDLSNVIFGTRYHMTAGYAYDQSYYNGFGKWHAGIDIGAPAGTSVKAVVGGTVAWISDPNTSNAFIGINSDDGRQWVYGHVGNVNVSHNQRVNIGDNIAKIGSANHLHLEVENGHAYGNTQGAHSNQSFIKEVTLSPLQAYWEFKNENHETSDTSSGGTGSSGLVSSTGLEFIGNFEGFYSNLYNDPAGHATIGYGHLVHYGPINGSEPAEFQNGISQERALELLQQDANIAVQAVKDSVKVSLTQAQFDALVSFTFNVGVGYFNSLTDRDGFKGSDLLLRLNEGNYDAVPGELNRWVYGGGVVLPGLVRRREEEGILFRDGIYTGIA